MYVVAAAIARAVVAVADAVDVVVDPLTGERCRVAFDVVAVLLGKASPEPSYSEYGARGFPR